MANREKGKKVEAVTDFFLGSNFTVDSDCSHEIRRQLLLNRKALTNLDSVLKIKDITLLTKICIVKVMVFPVVTYGCESWTIKKAKCQRLDTFELWCWRRLLRVPWTARRSNQSILEEIDPEYSLEGLMLKLTLQYFGHLMANNWLIGKDPDTGKDWRQKEKRAIEDEMVGWHHWCNRMNLCKLWEMVRDREAWCAAVHGIPKSLTWLGDWTTTALP